MSEETRNILALSHDSETTEFIKSVFSGACTVTPVNNIAEVSQKAGDNFDVILTGYIVPEVSGEKATSYLSDIQKAFDDASSTLREIANADETLLKEREREQANILTFLQEHVHRAEQEKASLKQEMQAVMEKDEVYLKEKTEAEAKAVDALKARDEAEAKTEDALKARDEAEAEAEAALKDKDEAEKKTETALTVRAEAEAKAAAALKAQEKAEAEAEAALNEKNEAEAGIAKLREEDAGRITQITGEVNRLNEELEKATALAEQNHAEKASIEEKLTKLQEN